MPADKRVGIPFKMLFKKAPLRMWRLEKGDRVPLHFVAAQTLDVYFDTDRGEYRCRTRGYWYTVSDRDLREIVSWHWHPDAYPRPHVHVDGGIDGHIPTGRVSFESVARFMIEELGTEPAKSEWDEVLAAEEARHRPFRSWS